MNKNRLWQKIWTKILRQVIDNLPQAAFAVDEKGILIAWNPAMADLTKADGKYILGTKQYHQVLKDPSAVLVDLVLHQNSDPDSEMNPQAMKVFELYNPEFKPESSFQIHLSPIYAGDDHLLGVVQFFTDISEKIRTEELLAEDEFRFSALFHQSNDAIFLHDIEGNIVDFNQKARDLFQLPMVDISNLDLADVIPLHRIDFHSKGLNEQEIKIQGEREIFAEFRTSRFEFGGKNIYQTIVRDITEKKMLHERQLKTLKMDSISLLAGGIAHDFNNILTSILGNISILKTDEVKLPIEQEELLNEAETAIKRATDLTHQLLTFAKGGSPVLQHTSIQEIIEDTARFTVRGTGIGLNLTFDENLFPVNVDAGQISQVINNLVLNAIQAMPTGGNISICCENKRNSDPWRSNNTENLFVEITVEDEGEGIPPEILDRIFDPYFTTKEKGSGLGLSVCYSIITKHEGTIDVISKPGLGTRFHIVLPAIDTMDSLSQKENISNSLPLKNVHKIMIMDDDPAILRVLSKILEKEGYEVDQVREGRSLLEKVMDNFHKGKQYDLFMMDLTIQGGIGGKETIKNLLEVYPSAQAIVMSGYSKDPIMSDYESYGFQYFLRKPFTALEVKDAIMKSQMR